MYTNDDWAVNFRPVYADDHYECFDLEHNALLGFIARPIVIDEDGDIRHRGNEDGLLSLIVDRDTGLVIGRFGSVPHGHEQEVHCFVDVRYRRKGVGSIAIQYVAGYANYVGRVAVAYVQPGNISCEEFLKKNEFHLAGLCKQRNRHEGLEKYVYDPASNRKDRSLFRGLCSAWAMK